MQRKSNKEYLAIAILPIIVILILLYKPISTYIFGKEITIEAIGSLYDDKYYDYEYDDIGEIDIQLDNHTSDDIVYIDGFDYTESQIPSYIDEFSSISLDTESIEKNKNRWDKNVVDYSEKMFEKYKDDYTMSDKSRRNAYIILEREGEHYVTSLISLSKPTNKLFIKCSIHVYEDYIDDERTIPGIGIDLDTKSIYYIKIEDVEYEFMRRIKNKIECKVYLKYKLYNGFLLKVK